MADENEVKALADRLYDAAVSNAGSPSISVWETAQHAAREALRWRDETRPQQPAALAGPIDFGDLLDPFYEALDELFGRGWGEALRQPRRYDPRGTKEYQAVIDVVRAALAQQPAAAVPDDVARDAARYRWLRDESWAGYNVSKRHPKIAETIAFVDGMAGGVKTILAEDALDSAIDRAMLAAVRKGGES